MYLFVTSFICIVHCTYGITINTPIDKADQVGSKSAGNQDKRSLLIGDLSYSYAATDIGSDEGSHIKTITVIKNIGSPTFKKSHHHHHNNDDEPSWDNNSKNRFNFVFKLPEFPNIDTSNFFHKDKPKRVIPTKQPTDRQTPVINTENDDPPNINRNIDQNVPQVYDISQDENSSEPLPNPMTLLNTEGNNGQMENTGNKEASDDVEYIQTNDDNLPPEMAAAQMFHSQKKHTYRVGKFNDNRNSNGRQIANQQKQLQSQRHSTEFLEDFSDYSMHNVKHLNDPLKVKDSFLKYTQNHPKRDSKQFSTPVQSARTDQQYDSYGNVVEKSQSLLDASQDRKTLSYSINPQPSKRPYISPSIQKTYVHTSTELPVTQSSNVRASFSTTTSKSGVVQYFSTTQKAYVAPKKLKAAQNINSDHSFVNPSMEPIQQPIFNSAIQMPEIEYQQTEYHLPPKQSFQYQESNQQQGQQHKTYSIRNPLTTSLPVQHNKPQKLQNSPKMKSYIAVPIEANTQSYRSDSPKERLSHLPKRFVRHHIVFGSKPPYAFMESPFQPVKSMLMG